MRGDDRLWLGLVLAGCVVALSSAGLSFMHFDDPLYAQVAKNVVATGDWITLRHAAYAQVDKPPLSIWLMAVSIHAAGETPVAFRLWHLLITIALVWTTYQIARRGAERGQALLAALVVLTTLMVQQHMLMPQQDIPLTLFLALALLAYYDYRQRGRTRDALLAGVWMALAMLTKGLVGPALFGLVAASDLIVAARRRESGHWRWSQVALGAAVFLTIAAPWFIAGAMRQGSAFIFMFTFGRMGVARAIQPAAPALPYAWWLISYFPILFIGMSPWTAALPSALGGLWQDLRGNSGPLYRLCGLWVALPFLALSILPTDHEIRYLLLIFPPVAVLTARALARMLRASRGTLSRLRSPLLTPAVISLLLGILGGLLSVRLVATQNPAGANMNPILQPAVLAVSAGLIGGGLAFALGRARHAIAILAVGAVIGHGAFIFMAARHWDALWPWQAAADTIAARHRPGERVFVVGEHHAERHFAHYYFPGPIVWVPHDVALAEAWGDATAFALVAPHLIERVLARGGLAVIYRMPYGWVVVTNGPRP